MPRPSQAQGPKRRYPVGNRSRMQNRQMPPAPVDSAAHPARGGHEVAVLGAGIVGAMVALALLRDGHRVTLIEPGPITSRIRENAIPHFERWVNWQASPRADQYRASLLKRLYEPSGRDRFELPPRAVSDRILTALTAANPAPRYYVTAPTRISGVARRVLPTRALDWFARRN